MQVAAPIEGFYCVSVTNSTRLGVRRIHFQQSYFLEGLHPCHVGKRRVQEVVGLSRQQFQRKCLRVPAVTGLFRRNKRRNRVEPQSFETLVVKQGFAIRGAEVAVGEGQEWLLSALVFEWSPLEIQPDVPFGLQTLARNPAQPGIGRFQRLVHHVLDRILEALVLEPHSLGQRSE